MKHRLMRTGIALSIAALALTGCEKNPVDPTNIKGEERVERVSQNSASIHSTVSSVLQVGELLRGADAKLEHANPVVANPGAAAGVAKKAAAQAIAAYVLDKQNNPHLGKVLGDSLIWEVFQRKEFEGYSVRWRVYYDFATGIARAEEIKFNFDDRHKISYDSVAVVVDVHFTLEDESDDVIRALFEQKQYKPGEEIVQEEISVAFGDYPAGEEPTSGTAEHRITYAPGSFIASTIEQAEIKGEDEGSWMKDVTYSDGTTSHEKVTFSPGGKGTVEQVKRDGTKVEGSFDSADDDGEGSFSLTTTFPPGSDPKSIHEEGSFSQNLADSTLHGSYKKEVHFANGVVLEESIEVDESIKDGRKTTSIVAGNSDGSKGKIIIEERDYGEHVSGEWEEADGLFTLFEADYYNDGSARLQFWTYASRSAYENGEEPVASGLFNFYPDNSGSGKVTDGGQEYNVTINADGSQEVSP